jgi:hypothetical protein
VNAKVLQLRVRTADTHRWKEEEQKRWDHRAEKRRERAKKRRAAKKTKEAIRAVTHHDVLHAVTTRDYPPEDLEGPRRTDGVVYEPDFEMPEPSCGFREALAVSIAALNAVDEVVKRRDVLVDRLAKLALAEARRMELLAAGNVAGENDTREGVAHQLLAAAMGLRVIAANDWEVDEDTPLRVSRARRRYQQRAWKGRAKALRRYENERLHHDQTTGVRDNQEGVYQSLNDIRYNGRRRARRLTEAEAAGLVVPYAENSLRKIKGERRRQKCYAYHSGSHYEQPVVKVIGLPGESVRVAKLKVARAVTVDLLPTAMVEVKGERKPIKLDTCAQYSVAGKWWQQYGERVDAAALVDYMEGFSGTAVKVLGVWEFRFVTQYQQPMVGNALRVDSQTRDFLVGEDWMYDHGVKIDFVASEMKWYDEDAKVVVGFSGIGAVPQPEIRTAKARLIRRAKVHTQTVHNVKIAVAAPDGRTGVFMPKMRNQDVARTRRWQHLLLAPTIATVRKGGITVPILSLMGRTTKLPRKEALGTWVPNDGEMEIMEVTSELNRERVQQWLDKEMRVVEEPLSNEADLELCDMEDAERELMIKMLRCFPSLLEPREGYPPATTLGVEHEIHTGDAPPINVRPRRHAHEERKVIDDGVDGMLHGGVVERSHGAWGFPVVLVKKKDGTVRFCIDYRMLNDVTCKDVYPLPRIDETLENMHGAQRFSSLDLHAGYWQVPVAMKDRDKTVFVTRKGLFRFVRMPFGLANAPGTFQRMMDAVMRGLTWQCCLVYLDDVIIFTKGSVARHVVELAAVLERLSSAGLSLKAKKCSFGTTRLAYLGHELDADGIRPMASLIRSVCEFPVPEDDRVVKRFVQLAGYYRWFIANFGSKEAAMTMLLRKGSQWEWGLANKRLLIT